MNLTSSSAACDLFEVYLFAMIVDAARREGAVVRYRDVFGAVPARMVFRTSPGRIFSRAHPYTHAVIEFPGKPVLEAHIGIFVSGRSGLPHECDVAVLLADEARVCRANDVHPRCAKVIISTECKLYAAGLPIHLARSFMGLTTDIYTENRFFVANTTSDSVGRLLTHHKRLCAQGILPNASTLINRLRARYETAFEQFKATH